MNRSRLRQIAALSIPLLLLLWSAVAWYLHTRSETIRQELEERQRLIQTYEILEKRWSAAVRKKALKKLETTLRLYRITPTVKKIREKKLYLFTLEKRDVDKVLGKVLELPLPIVEFEVTKHGDDRVDVRIGVVK